LFTVGLTPLLPASSELQSGANQKELEDIYFTISRGLYLYVIPVLVLIIVMAKPLIFVWLGEGYELAAYSVQFLLAASVFSTLLAPQYVILQGIGKPQINTIAHLIAGIGNLLISVPLTIRIGFAGVLVGLAVSEIVSDIYLFISFHSATGIKLKSYLEKIPVVAVIAFLLLGFLLGYSLTFITYWNPATLALYCSFYLLGYALVLKLGNVLDYRDRVLIYKLSRIIIAPR
jgi:O-antigen/teichoic acid export membrane protein